MLVYFGFLILPIAVATMIAWAGRSKALTLSILGWMMLSTALAQFGILRRFDLMPPPMPLFLISGLIGTAVIAKSRWVRHLIELPLGILVGFHGFRVVVEILIHQSSTIGLAPAQMTWSGYNFDIATGLTALLLAPFARSMPKWLVIVWNCLGLTLLFIVIGIAAASFPTRFQRMHPDNSWVASFPYVWLPAILVTAALLGHLVIFRKLASQRSPGVTPA
jgi:hypothetical protein